MDSEEREVVDAPSEIPQEIWSLTKAPKVIVEETGVIESHVEETAPFPIISAAVRRRIRGKRRRPEDCLENLMLADLPSKQARCENSTLALSSTENLLNQTRTIHPVHEMTCPTRRPPIGVTARVEWRKRDARCKAELQLMRELRTVRDAPVDSLFNLSIADPDCAPVIRRFHVFVAVFLSSQTRDEVTAEAMRRLKQKIAGGLTVDSVLKCRRATLAKLMKPVAFHNTKAENLKSIASLLKAHHNADVPVDVDALCELPGIGPKMAHIVVSTLTGNPQGIGIDVHVHRITNKLGWVISKEPEQTREQLQKLLPYSEWAQVNLIMVGLGQQMNSAKTVVLQRCFETSRPVAALRLLQKLDFDISWHDKASGQGSLHWAAAAGDADSLRMLLKVVKPQQDSLGQWPWDASTSEETLEFFARSRGTYQ